MSRALQNLDQLKQLNERAETLLAQEQNNPATLWWLSFCYPDRPHGQQFLGVIIVEAQGFISAHAKAWALGINPGGEIRGCEVEGIAPKYHNRLLSRAELDAAGFL